MSFLGIDPIGLGDLATTLGYRADAIAAAGARASAPLERHGRVVAADRVGTRLSTMAGLIHRYARDLGWRIDAILRESGSRPFGLPAAGPFVGPAKLALAVEVGSGPPVTTRATPQRQVRELAGQTPAEVASYFAGLTGAEINVLIVADPRVVTDLDGAPPWARYAASDLLIGERIAVLERQAAATRRLLRRAGLQWYETLVLRGHLVEVADEAAELALWLQEDRQILLFDPAGDGRVVEVFGDLAAATNIGVVVPGITNDRTNFSEGDGGFRANARNIHERAGELGIGSVATVAWLGYDTPDGADAVFRRAATESYGDLVRFVQGMDALDGRRHIAVIGHSYGSLVTGMAARAGLAASEVVFVGSPGTSLSHADDASLKPGGVVWAGLAYADPIGAGIDISEFVTPRQQLQQTMRRLLDSLDGEQAIRDLHHGTNPAHEDFEALEFHTDGSTGHSDYFKPETETLDNLVYIIAGMDGRVSIEIPDEIELAPGPIGEPWEPVGETV